MYGQFEAGYLSFFDAFERIGVKNLRLIHGEQEAARSCGIWWCFKDFAIATERPLAIRRDGQGRLHSGTHPAIIYPDGWGFYAWHGRRVPQWVILDPTPKRIADEDNVEVRRCGIESMGWDRFIAKAELDPITQGTFDMLNPTAGHITSICHDEARASVPDPGNPGQFLTLYRVPERLWGSRVNLLLCTNGSVERDGTRRQYGLTVPANIHDPLAAAAWTAGLSVDEYARMVRRT